MSDQYVPFTFNARNVEPQMGFEAWPDAWYPVVIVKSNNKLTKDGNGRYLELTVECGPMVAGYAGKQNFIRINVKNASQTAIDIAQKTLSAICRVIGVYDVQEMPTPDMAVPMLHGKPFQVHFVVQKNPDTGQIGNNPSGFKDMAGNDPIKAGAGMQNPNPPNQPQQQPSSNFNNPNPGFQQPAPGPQPGAGAFQQPQGGFANPNPNAGFQGTPQPNPGGFQQPNPNGGFPSQQQPQPNSAPNPNANWTQNPNQQATGPWGPGR